MQKSPPVRVRLIPKSSISLPDKGPPMAMPANITVAVSPISGVLTSSLSRMTDDTGRTIPNPRPPVNMAARIAGNGFSCFCVLIIIFYLDGF